MTTQPEIAKFSSHSLVDLIFDNRKTVAGLIIAMLVGVGAYTAYDSYKERRAAQAASALYSANEKVLAAAGPNVHGKELLQKAAGPLKDLEDAARAHAGTMPSFEAFMRLGDIHLAAGDHGSAATFYADAEKSAPSRGFRALALYSVGMAREGSNDHKGAIEAFRGALGLGEKISKAELLMGLARNYAASGDEAKAKEQLAIVAAEFPNSDYSRASERLKASLK